MGQQQSRDELLYQQVSYGNVEGIKVLRREGAGLEWIDKEGKTPLILACMKPDYLHVAKTLIELGANVNGYRPGSHGGTPLHHAAKRGLEHTVKLLLSHGANPLIMNDDVQSPLDVARAKGHTSVVRAIESYICLFSGWLRELHGPGFLEAFAPQWVSKKVWAVVIPRGSRDPSKPQKFELAIYPAPQVEREEPVKRRRRRRRRRRREMQVAQPRTVIVLWKAIIEEVNFKQSDPTVVIVDKAAKTRYKFLSENEGDKQQLHWFYNACRGMHQPVVPVPAIPVPATAPSSTSEDVELAIALNASIQLAMEQGVPVPTRPAPAISNTNDWGPTSGPPLPPPKTISIGWLDEPAGSSNTFNGWGGGSEAGSSGNPTQLLHENQVTQPPNPASSQTVPPAVPSAPPIPEEIPVDDGPIHYPTIDSSPVDLTVPKVETAPVSSEPTENTDTSSCVICLDAPKEAACVPCGHVVGCMNCLNDIKAKNWGCPVCRAKISQVIKLYTV